MKARMTVLLLTFLLMISPVAFADDGADNPCNPCAPTEESADSEEMAD